MVTTQNSITTAIVCNPVFVFDAFLSNFLRYYFKDKFVRKDQQLELNLRQITEKNMTEAR